MNTRRSILTVVQAVVLLCLVSVPASCQRAPATAPDSAGGLVRVAEIPLPGPAVRFDYQTVDTTADRLYVAHMNAGTLLVFDTKTRKVIANLPGFPSVHGVVAVPSVGKVFASATGEHRVVIVSAATLKSVARVGPIGYPDGLAFAPDARRVFVSDESRAGRELVIDAVGDSVLGGIDLGGEAGNTIWDPVSRRILVAVQTRAEIAAIDASTARIVARYPVTGSERPHGLVIDPVRKLLFAADEAKSELFVIQLPSMRVLSHHSVGDDPDVLAVDPELGRLYVACESGVVDVFQVEDGRVVSLGRLAIPHAHTVAVHPVTHLVYLPIQQLGGRPVLEIYRPKDVAGER
jgi:DNA-binding beta-propeller fold protein YncE